MRARQPTAQRTMAACLGAAAWAGSWFMMYREITHWHHVKPSLAFNSDIAPDAHPGVPLLLLYGVCAAAPIVTIAGAVGARRSRR
ncbi:hypothetical protein [Actinoplanes subtropicus]|uniref:hypothetical protein n=1 Tax=Actinoplanes subtropicus TaxID=543632 RepID=UPI0004C443E4|nr:hypothetical protein [Actinoplanes subtropicus]